MEGWIDGWMDVSSVPAPQRGARAAEEVVDQVQEEEEAPKVEIVLACARHEGPFVNAHIYIYIYVDMCICVYICDMHCICKAVCTYIYIYIDVDKYIHGYVYVCIYMYMYLCMYVNTPPK